MRLKFDARARALLRRLPVVNVYSLAELALLALLATQCARLAWTIATPVSPLGDWRPAEPGVPGAPAEILRGFDPFFRITGGEAAPVAVTSASIKLFGTRIDEAMGRGGAIVAGADGVQKSVSVGEEIEPGVTLREVAFDNIVIERGGARETLYLDQSQGGATGAGGVGTGGYAPVNPPAPGGTAPPMTVDRLQADIGFIPQMEGGQVRGLVVREQGTGAAFRAAGLREGDVVTQVGGRQVTGPDDIARLERQYRGGGAIPMTVLRDGRPTPLSLTVAPR